MTDNSNELGRSMEDTRFSARGEPTNSFKVTRMSTVATDMSVQMVLKVILSYTLGFDECSNSAKTRL